MLIFILGIFQLQYCDLMLVIFPPPPVSSRLANAEKGDTLKEPTDAAALIAQALKRKFAHTYPQHDHQVDQVKHPTESPLVTMHQYQFQIRGVGGEFGRKNFWSNYGPYVILQFCFKKIPPFFSPTFSLLFLEKSAIDLRIFCFPQFFCSHNFVIFHAHRPIFFFFLTVWSAHVEINREDQVCLMQLY